MPPHRCRSGAFADWCHDWRLFRGWYGICRQPRRGDLGASVLVRAGCGEGECGGARLVGSEKSPIVTLRWCVGLGGLIENVLSRRGLRSPTELAGGTSVICRKSQSSPGIAVPGMWLGRAALTQPEPSAALPRPGRFARLVARSASVAQVRVAGHCQLREWTAARQG